MGDKRHVHSHSAEIQVQQSFKKPRISESATSSWARMSNSSAFRSRQTGLAKGYSEPCLRFKRGKCDYGNMCIYVHDETRNARNLLYPFSGKVAAEHHHQMIDEMIVRDRLCKYFMKGQTCPYGNSCQFAHDVKGGSGMLYRDNAAVPIPVVMNTRDAGEYRKRFDETGSQRVENLNSDASQMQPSNAFWKTKLCRKWERFGSCPYGLKCHYAHGESELCKPGSLHQLESGKSCREENIAVDQENAASTEEVMKTSFKQKGNRCRVKLDSIGKINRIYADWIESIPPVNVISSGQ